MIGHRRTVLKRKKTRTKHSYYSKRWREFRKKMLKDCGYKCASCSALNELHVHHIKPVYDGGDFYNPDNIEVVCRSCHMELHKEIAASYLQPWERALKNLANAPIPTT